jgi:phospholipid/cholesterol/gamma-HCH transport system ATP-binding protein
MIELVNVKKGFGTKVVVNGVSSIMQSSTTNLIIGSSGSGKTVLLKCMIGLFKPDEGQVLYEGIDLYSMNEGQMKEVRKQIGMLFQGSALFDSKTVKENVQFPLDMFTNLTTLEKEKRVDEVLERVRIQGAHQKSPAEISGGMKKRVALARAIVLNPKYLFCDEPNSGLDPQTSIVIDELIKEITEDYKMTTIINTHDMNTVMESGDHILYMHQGLKQWEGSSKEIFTSQNTLLNDFVFASSMLRELREFKQR